MAQNRGMEVDDSERVELEDLREEVRQLKIAIGFVAAMLATISQELLSALR